MSYCVDAVKKPKLQNKMWHEIILTNFLVKGNISFYLLIL